MASEITRRAVLVAPALPFCFTRSDTLVQPFEAFWFFRENQWCDEGRWEDEATFCLEEADAYP